jgi:hypothetical protein
MSYEMNKISKELLETGVKRSSLIEFCNSLPNEEDQSVQAEVDLISEKVIKYQQNNTIPKEFNQIYNQCDNQIVELSKVFLSEKIDLIFKHNQEINEIKNQLKLTKAQLEMASIKPDNTSKESSSDFNSFINDRPLIESYQINFQIQIDSKATQTDNNILHSDKQIQTNSNNSTSLNSSQVFFDKLLNFDSSKLKNKFNSTQTQTDLTSNSIQTQTDIVSNSTQTQTDLPSNPNKLNSSNSNKTFFQKLVQLDAVTKSKDFISIAVQTDDLNFTLNGILPQNSSTSSDSSDQTKNRLKMSNDSLNTNNPNKITNELNETIERIKLNQVIIFIFFL